MALSAHFSYKRLALAVLVLGLPLLLPITPQGVQGTPMGLLINQGVEAYDGVYGRPAAYTVCTASPGPVAEVAEDGARVFEFRSDSSCRTFDSVEQLNKYLRTGGD